MRSVLKVTVQNDMEFVEVILLYFLLVHTCHVVMQGAFYILWYKIRLGIHL
jgi:hypothetical protein